MARTAWLTELQRQIKTLRQIRSVEKGRGIPNTGVQGIRPDLDPQRRNFLLTSLAATASLATPRWARAAGKPNIAIVGGGIAGLTCALTLADRGIRATVYEASHRVGGRMFSNTRTWDQHQVSEWGGEMIDTGHRTIRSLAKRFDLPLDDLLAAEPTGSQDTHFFDGHYYPRDVTLADFSALIDALEADIDGADYPTQWNAYTPMGYRLDHMSIDDWILTRVPGGLQSRLGQLLQMAYIIEYGADTHDQSALNLLYLLGYQPKPNGFSVFGESDERFHIRGGNEQLPRAIAQHLGIGSNVLLGKRLVRITQTPGRRYCLAFDTNGRTEETIADYVVLALPFAVLRKIDYSKAGFDGRKCLAIETLGRGRNSKLQLQCTHRFWRQPGSWPAISNANSYSDTGYQSAWEVTRAQPGTAGILNFYSGGTVSTSFQSQRAFATASDPRVIVDVHRVMNQAEEVFPGLNAAWNGKATLSLPHKSALFGASYAYYRVGQYTRFGGYEGVRQGGVFFCGEHTSTDFQGFMEGGASEGRRTGKALVRIV